MRYILLIVICALVGVTFAQPVRYRSPNGISDKKNYNRRATQPYFLSFRCGLTQFYGELNAQAMHGIAGIGIGRSLNKQFAVQLDYNAGTIGGEKKAFFNSWFVNEYNSAECLVKWDLSEQFSQREPGPVHMAVYAGVGQIWFSANAFDLDGNRLLRLSLIHI